MPMIRRRSTTLRSGSEIKMYIRMNQMTIIEFPQSLYHNYPFDCARAAERI